MILSPLRGCQRRRGVQKRQKRRHGRPSDKRRFRVSGAKWFIVLPPDGAARSAGLETVKAFSQLVNPADVKAFDCKVYLDAFNKMLKDPDEPMVV